MTITTRTLSEAQSVAALVPLGVRFPRQRFVESSDDTDALDAMRRYARWRRAHHLDDLKVGREHMELQRA